MTHVECGYPETEFEGGCPNSGILEREGDPVSSLLTFYAADKAGDLYRDRMDGHIAAQLFDELQPS